ncbi:MAG: hypothetical protein R6V19_01890 [Armatimonadota bacterium]
MHVLVTLGVLVVFVAGAVASQPPVLQIPEDNPPPNAVWADHSVEIEVIYKDPDGDPAQWVVLRMENLSMPEASEQRYNLKSREATDNLSTSQWRDGVKYYMQIKQLPAGDYRYYVETQDEHDNIHVRLPKEPERFELKSVAMTYLLILAAICLVASYALQWILGMVLNRALGVHIRTVVRLKIVFFCLFAIASIGYLMLPFGYEAAIIVAVAGVIVMIAVLLILAGRGRSRSQDVSQPPEKEF